jgi:hypothetical protein
MTAPVLAIVDDYQPFLDYLAMFLRARGYDVRPYLRAAISSPRRSGRLGFRPTRKCTTHYGG